MNDSGDYNVCLNQIASSNCSDDPACVIAENGANQHIISTNVGIEISQPIYNPALWGEAKQAATQVQQSQMQRTQQQQLFLANMIDTYLLTLSARESAETTQAELEFQTAQLQQLERQFEKGLMPASDVLYGRAMLDLQEASLDQKKRETKNAFRAMQALAQQPIVGLSRLRSDIPMPKPNPSNPGQWIELAKQRNPQILQLQYQVTLSEQEIAKRKGQRKPQVNLVGSVGSSLTARSGAFEQQAQANSAQINLELSMPLYAGGGLKTSINEAQNLHQQAQLKLSSTQEHIFSDIDIAFNSASSSLRHIGLLQNAIDSLKLRLNNLEKGFEKGVVNAQQVLDARKELFTTQKNKQIARFDYIRSSITLKKLAGVISEHDIHVIASWSDTSTVSGAQKTLFDQAKEWLSYE